MPTASLREIRRRAAVAAGSEQTVVLRDFTVCKLCGRPLRSLGSHLHKVHHVSVPAYRLAFGIPPDQPLGVRRAHHVTPKPAPDPELACPTCHAGERDLNWDSTAKLWRCVRCRGSFPPPSTPARPPVRRPRIAARMTPCPICARSVMNLPQHMRRAKHALRLGSGQWAVLRVLDAEPGARCEGQSHAKQSLMRRGLVTTVQRADGRDEYAIAPEWAPVVRLLLARTKAE